MKAPLWQLLVLGSCVLSIFGTVIALQHQNEAPISIRDAGNDGATLNTIYKQDKEQASIVDATQVPLITAYAQSDGTTDLLEKREPRRGSGSGGSGGSNGGKGDGHGNGNGVKNKSTVKPASKHTSTKTETAKPASKHTSTKTKTAKPTSKHTSTKTETAKACLATEEVTKRSPGVSMHSEYLKHLEREIFKRGKSQKDAFFICAEDKIMKTIDLPYDRAGTLAEARYPKKGEAKRKELPIWTIYNPQKLCTAENYKFKDVQSEIKDLAEYKKHKLVTEHILEFHLLKHFFENLQNDKILSKREFDNPASDAFISTHKKKMSDKPKVFFCDYFKFWWGDWNEPKSPNKLKFKPKELSKLTLGKDEMEKFENTPLKLAVLAIPTNKIFDDEFMLLNGGANVRKEQMFLMKNNGESNSIVAKNKINGLKSGGKFSDAYGPMKEALLAVRYMQNDDVNAIFVKQAERVGSFLDQLEKQLLNIKADNKDYNKRKYEPLNLRQMWRNYIWDRTEAACASQKKFWDTNIPILQEDRIDDLEKKIKQTGLSAKDKGAYQNILDSAKELKKYYVKWEPHKWEHPLPKKQWSSAFPVPTPAPTPKSH